MAQRYVSFFTDFAFKRLFGTEDNKEPLKDFLNQVLAGEEVIEDLTFRSTEQLGSTEVDRRAVFDLYCVNEKGQHFIIELQKAKQKFFKDRSVFYSTFPIREQAQKGDWDFELKAVYTIGLLDFTFDPEPGEVVDETKYLHKVKLTEQETHKVFYDKLTMIYLEMPRFKKTEAEVANGTDFEKWVFILKNLGTLDRIPEWARTAVFEAFFEEAAIARFEPDEHDAYERSLKYYRDMNNVIATAKEEAHEAGRAKGREERDEELIAAMRAQGISEDLIRKILADDDAES